MNFSFKVTYLTFHARSLNYPPSMGADALPPRLLWKGHAMPANFVLGRWTVAPGLSVGFTFSWPPGQHPNKGPVFVMLSPDRPPRPEDVKITILNYAQARSVEGPVY